MPTSRPFTCGFFRRYARVFLCLLSVELLGVAVVTATPGSVSESPPQGLSATEWADLQAQIKAHHYQVRARESGGYQALNPAQGWRIDYHPDGRTRFSPSEADVPDYHIGFRLQGIGYGDGLQRMPSQPSRMQTHSGTLEYHWNETLIERWINNEAGPEQWFLLQERPSANPSGEPLRLQLRLDSDLTVRQIGNTLQFSDAAGGRIHYDQLKVWDADGQLQTAWLQLNGSQLSLLIDEQYARYPLTIDPSLQQRAYLKASNTGDYDDFGKSVAISGDTVVVGASGETSNATGVNGNQDDNSVYGAGAAYVFTRSGGIWTQQAYLKASNTEGNHNFGESVAISGDTVVARSTWGAQQRHRDQW